MNCSDYYLRNMGRAGLFRLLRIKKAGIKIIKTEAVTIDSLKDCI